MDEEVAKFLDTASNRVVLFSLGTFVRTLGKEQGQIFTDAFATLPHRVLWQSTKNVTGLQLGNNTMVARWLPMMKVMGIYLFVICTFTIFISTLQSLTVLAALYCLSCKYQ